MEAKDELHMIVLRPKEERKARTIILPVRLIRRLEELSEMTGTTQSELVTQAVEQFLPNVRVESAATEGSEEVR